ncbi:hypothetical protein AusDCA_3557 [Desulfitobacterium sp. AusDCA]
MLLLKRILQNFCRVAFLFKQKCFKMPENADIYIGIKVAYIIF